jgi:hypothetical protein
MYSTLIVDKRLHAFAQKTGIRPKRHPRLRSIEISQRLEKLRDEHGNLVRPLNAEESEFIRDERALCKADFEYYLTRYHTVELDPGVGNGSGNGPAPLLPSQVKFLRDVGKREEVCHEEMKRYKHTAGILAYAHKCRQVVFTSTCCGAKIHRMLFWPGTRAIAATLKDDETGTGELYKRDKLALDNLPFWLKPEIYPDVKDSEIGFKHPLNSRLTYQAENTRGAAGIGTGAQTDFSHFTEVPLWQYPRQIRFSFMPGVPKGPMTFHVEEGTAHGKGGYWQEVTEGCRHRKEGFTDWIYIFVGWYVNGAKWRSNAPDVWSPNEHTVKHAELIERTSPEFNDGVVFHPTKDQLFWWEQTRAMYAQTGELAAFLASYPATPEQSFVNFAAGALPVELIEKMEIDLRIPILYGVEVAA